MFERLVLASNNAGKAREIEQLLHELEIEVLLQSAFDVPSIEETGLSFIENAILKARHAAAHTGLPALADDSGLAVNALDGVPGIYSARYAGTDASDEANNEKLLQALEEVPDERRGACFYCAVVLLRHAGDPVPLVCTGAWEGRILHAPRGSRGFGYDPLFYVPGHQCASAELPLGEKNRISHRARALRKLREALGDWQL